MFRSPEHQRQCHLNSTTLLQPLHLQDRNTYAVLTPPSASALSGFFTAGLNLHLQDEYQSICNVLKRQMIGACWVHSLKLVSSRSLYPRCPEVTDGGCRLGSWPDRKLRPLRPSCLLEVWIRSRRAFRCRLIRQANTNRSFPPRSVCASYGHVLIARMSFISIRSRWRQSKLPGTADDYRTHM